MSGVEDASDSFWIENPNILTKRYTEMWPTPDQTLPERMNAITRFILVTCVVLSIYKSSIAPFQFGIFAIVLLVLFWKNQTIFDPHAKDKYLLSKKDGFNVYVDDVPCTMPTKENPFMNHLYGDPLDKPAACTGPGVQEQAVNLLNSQLYDDVDDLYNKNASQRLFMTTPSTTVPNDRESFMNWRFKEMENCKLNPADCYPYESLELQKPYESIAFDTAALV